MHPEVKHKREKNHKKRIEKMKINKETVEENFSGLNS